MKWAVGRENGGENEQAMRMAQVQLRILVAAGLCLLVASALAAPQIPPGGDWHLLRSKNPAGGPDAVSMNRSADMASDLDLAGLMLRCHSGTAEVLLIVISPFPPHSQPVVTVSANGQEWQFDATVVSPGAQLLLPGTATALASGSWQSANQLSVRISAPQKTVSGAIAIDGLRNALATLLANCPAG